MKILNIQINKVIRKSLLTISAIHKIYAWKIFLILLLFNVTVWISYFYVINTDLAIYFLDIGQGDSTLIKTPDNNFILIDGGPDNTILSKLSEVMPFWQKNIDLVILTHSDLDHLSGLTEVIKSYTIGAVVYSDVTKNSDVYKEFERLITSNNIKILGYTDKDDLKIGCCTYINFLWPKQETDLMNLDTNNTSITFELVYKNTNAFFGGDLESEYEDKLVDEDSFLDVDLLKVSHHGSDKSTSKEFVQKLSPDIAIVSVGKENIFGHPKESVIKIFKQFGIPVLRTDEIGTIRVWSNGGRLIY